MAVKKGTLSIDSENIFPIIKKWVYSDHDIFVRELVSNGCDAITKLKKLDMMGEYELPEGYKPKIEVIVNPEEKTMKFIDNGLGMTAEEVEEYITQIAFSGATQFLEKYKDIPFQNNKALPVVSNQKMNEYLKELGELAEIDEPVRETYYKGNERIDEVTPKYALLSTHTGRRTFICNALALGIPVQVVMKWTGHSDYKAMKPYIDIADDIKIQAMNKFNLL